MRVFDNDKVDVIKCSIDIINKDLFEDHNSASEE